MWIFYFFLQYVNFFIGFNFYLFFSLKRMVRTQTFMTHINGNINIPLICWWIDREMKWMPLLVTTRAFYENRKQELYSSLRWRQEKVWKVKIEVKNMILFSSHYRLKLWMTVPFSLTGMPLLISPCSFPSLERKIKF
jgi:hypothetical protein